MSKLVWDKTGERYYHTGVSHGVFYPKTTEGKYTPGVAWNGLTNITESPSGADPTALWADNMKYLELRAAEEFGFTIEAYTYPTEFEECDGQYSLAEGVTVGQQPRKPFGMSYRTEIGNDIDYEQHGYLLHIVYGASVSPSEKAYGTINDSPEAITFSWEATTTPLVVDGLDKPISTITVNSTKVPSAKLKELEDLLYGTVETEAQLPLPEEIKALFEEGTGE